ncbi:MAG: 30S ribosomal protein S9 [Candidatus Diapherotrites archaeon]|nr:30S ribosomal protein S9 [Candidatus Diapherotrites archaeon]
MSAKKSKFPYVKAKKKQAIAHATIHKGKGVVRVNGQNMARLQPPLVRMFIEESLELAGPLGKEVDVNVHVHGGGFMGQAVAIRSCIAKALTRYSRDEKLRKSFLAYDRLLLVDDPRRVESKKPLGPKARRKKQKSKR